MDNRVLALKGGEIYLQRSRRMGKYYDSSPINLHGATSASLNGGWSSLPDDLLGLILDKLLNNSVYDYIRCATVCKSWFRYCLQQHYQHRRYNKIKTNHQLPLLFIPTHRSQGRTYVEPSSERFKYKNGASPVPGLGSAIDRSTHIPNLYNIMCKKICGSSHGWLIFADTKRAALTLTLFNPFTSAAIIRLPPLLENYEIKKVVLSNDPSANDNYELLVLQCEGRLALFTSNRWIYDEDYFDCSGFSFDDDHIFHMNQKFYALISGKLGTIEIVDSSEEDDTRGSYVRLEGSANEIYSEPWCQSYLAESIRGTLLFVQKFRTGVPFRVYEIEEESDDEGLIKRFIPKEGGGEKGLEDQALFLGPFNDSVSVRASDFPGCKPNSIYVIADAFRPVQVGVYTLGDHDINPLYKLRPHLPRPIWIQPRPNLDPFLYFFVR